MSEGSKRSNLGTGYPHRQNLTGVVGGGVPRTHTLTFQKIYTRKILSLYPMTTKEIIQNNLVGIVTLVFVAGGLYFKLDSMDSIQKIHDEQIEDLEEAHREDIKEVRNQIHDLELRLYESKCNK